MTNIVTLKPILKSVIGSQYTRHTRPILTKVLSNGADLRLTDLETTVLIKGANLPAGLLDLEGLGLTNKASDLDINDFPVMPEVQGANSIKVSIKHLEMLMDSVSNDETRLYLCGICWANTDLVSINGYIATIISGQVQNSNNSSIMPSKSIKTLIKLAKKFKLSEIELMVDSMYFQVNNKDFTLIGRLIDREFPTYQAVMPVKTSYEMVITAPVKYKEVKDILNRNKAVRLEVSNNLTSLVVDQTDFTQQVGSSDFQGTIGFNLKYLEFLTNLDSRLMFNNELSPVKVVSGNITRIAMPLKI